MLLWLPWTQIAWSANAVPGNQRSVRPSFLIGTAASVPMAAAVETAFDGSGLLFDVLLVVIHLMPLGDRRSRRRTHPDRGSPES